MLNIVDGVLLFHNLVDIDPCSSAPCLNGAICTSVSPMTFNCQCTPDYTGTTCSLRKFLHMQQNFLNNHFNIFYVHLPLNFHTYVHQV